MKEISIVHSNVYKVLSQAAAQFDAKKVDALGRNRSLPFKGVSMPFRRY